jgi:adenylosuccinate synthase
MERNSPLELRDSSTTFDNSSIEPYAMLNEAEHLQQLGCNDIWSRLFISEDCVVITPVHQAANRLRELARGHAAHGTCGQGVGEATADAIEFPNLTILAGDMPHRRRVELKLREVAAHKARQFESTIESLRHNPAAAADLFTIRNLDWVPVAAGVCADVAAAANIVRQDVVREMLRQEQAIFEGAQGVLLDQDVGFHPHTTWSRTTPANALQLLAEAGIETQPRKIGVLRCYATRHGNGPFPSEEPALRSLLIEPHNSDSGHQGRFRVGVFDAVAARYALRCADVDELALTHLDRIKLLPPRICTGYELNGQRLAIESLPPGDLQARSAQTSRLSECRPVHADISTEEKDHFAESLSHALGVKLSIVATGPARTDWDCRS